MDIRNVLLFSLDTLRADHLGCYGYHRRTSPHLDGLASGGAVFETCLAPVIPTFPAHTTIFTGRDVFDHRIVGQHHGDNAPVCEETCLTLAQRLQSAGWFCAAADNLGRWFKRGYDLYEGYAWETDPTQPWRKGEAVGATALRVLDQCAAQDRPWFCFMHYWDPHTPYLPPPPFDRMFWGGDEKDPANPSARRMWDTYDALRDYFASWMPDITDLNYPIAQYDAEIAYLDACLQHLWARMDALDLWRETLVILTADHGEELDEHEMWFDHHGLYETNLHVPLILIHPSLGVGKRPGGMVCHRDIVPSVLDAVGLPADATLPGRSLLPLARDNSAAGTIEELYICESTWLKKYGWRTADWKLIIDIEDPHHGTPPVELYHLPSDPAEQRNLADSMPDVTTELRAACEAHRRRRIAETGRPDPLEAVGLAHRKIGNPRAAVPDDPKR